MKGKRERKVKPCYRPHHSPALNPLPTATSLWADTSQFQWPPGSLSLLGHTHLWKTAQRFAYVGICPLSSPSPSPSPCTVRSGDPSRDCSGGRGASACGTQSFHTSSTCCHLSDRAITGKLQWACAQTSFSRTWWPASLRVSSG